MAQPINRLAARKKAPERLSSPGAELADWDSAWATWYGRKADLGHSPDTLAIYRYNRARIDLYRADHGIAKPEDFTPAQVLAFRREMEESGLARTSVHQHLRTLRTFLRSQGVWEPPSDGETPLPKLTEADHRVVFFSAAEKEDLRRAATRPRDRMIVEVLLRTGIREAELVGLTLASVTDTTLRVVGKGRKTRTIPLLTAQGNFATSLRRYIATQRPQDALSDRLFLGLRRPYNPITKAVVDRICLNLQDRTGIEVFTHKFRHTFATDCLRQGVDLLTLKELLGHTTLEMVAVYAHVTAANTAAQLASKHF